MQISLRSWTKYNRDYMSYCKANMWQSNERPILHGIMGCRVYVNGLPYVWSCDQNACSMRENEENQSYKAMIYDVIVYIYWKIII